MTHNPTQWPWPCDCCTLRELVQAYCIFHNATHGVRTAPSAEAEKQLADLRREMWRVATQQEQPNEQ